jgi:hypothetical protein
MLRRCVVCHGAHRKEANLDLRSKAAMLRGGKSGPAIVVGKPNESLIVKRALAGEMPPRERLVEASIKPIESPEIDVLVRWIAAGAAEVFVSPDVATTMPDSLVSKADRDFWAFQPVRAVPVPVVRATSRLKNPVDAFIQEKLEQRQLGMAPEADRVTLIRRASFDLTGLPPEPAEVRNFLADRSLNAWERVIDRLLESPRYGERWGRYWLDLAGYADSEGKREQDLPRPHAWRYRDYVIRSFNSDKPYNRFVLEQIAGDELANYEQAPEITAEVYDNLVATGFLRMAPDATWANITGFLHDRVEVIADEMDVLGSALMGLTLKCARCHDHKIDPIPQRDYFRMLDIFKGAFDEYDWLKPDVRPGLGPVSQDFLGGRHLPYVTTTERRAWEANNAEIQREIAKLRASTHNYENVQKRIRDLEARKNPEPRIQALWDRGEASPTYIYRRGDPLSPGRLVGPGVPSVLTDGRTPFVVSPPWPGANKTGRRLAFGRWLTRDDHPLTARVIVNRIWKHHFGTGIVKTVGNFGKAGSPPSHPELLDWLSREFVRQGWSIKAMHRLMMASATYRQSSTISPDSQRLDPDNSLLSRMPMSRLDSEALYDSNLFVSGRLDETRFGPPAKVSGRADGLVSPVASSRGWRRMIYVQQARKQLPTHLETFDFPQMNPNCIERQASTVATQALHLMNNGMVQQLADSFARRVWEMAGNNRASQVESVYWIALGRPPTGEETAIGIKSLEQFALLWKGKTADEEYKSLATYCHAMVNSAAFVYVD